MANLQVVTDPTISHHLYHNVYIRCHIRELPGSFTERVGVSTTMCLTASFIEAVSRSINETRETCVASTLVYRRS